MPVVGLLVFSVGWRGAALASGISILLVVVPLSFLMRRSPEGMGLHPDGLEPAPVTSPRRGKAENPAHAQESARIGPRFGAEEPD